MDDNVDRFHRFQPGCNTMKRLILLLCLMLVPGTLCGFQEEKKETKEKQTAKSEAQTQEKSKSSEGKQDESKKAADNKTEAESKKDAESNIKGESKKEAETQENNKPKTDEKSKEMTKQAEKPDGDPEADKLKETDGDKKANDAKKEEPKPAPPEEALKEKYETVEIEGGYKVETVADRLIDPMAIAIHPTSADVYVADSGAMRIVKIKDGKMEPVIVGFKKQAFGMNSSLEVGPLAISFLDAKKMVVAVGGESGPGFCVYELPEAGKPPVQADKPTAQHGIAPKAESPKAESPKTNGIGYGMVATSEGVYVTTTMEAEQGWLLRADRKKDGITDFQRHVSTVEKSKVGTPMAITRAFDVGYFAVGEIGAMDKAGDSILTYYDETGKLLGQFDTGLNDISGLAFGPKRGRLFAIDYSAMAPEKGGLFKLIAEGKTGCRAEKLTELIKPTAMAFDKKGDLFITLRASKGENEKSGKLIKISGLDNPPKPKSEKKKEGK